MAELVMTEGKYTMIINLPRKLVKDLLEQHIYLDFWFLNLSFITTYCIECLHRFIPYFLENPLER